MNEVELKCTRCREFLPDEDFSKDSTKPERRKRCSYCRECSKILRSKPSYKISNRQSMRRRVLRRVGLTIEDYEQMFENQDGVCAICANPPGKKMLAIDHNHETGEVRGLLCGSCNTGIGLLQDSPDILAAALEYLQKKVR